MSTMLCEHNVYLEIECKYCNKTKVAMHLNKKITKLQADLDNTEKTLNMVELKAAKLIQNEQKIQADLNKVVDIIKDTRNIMDGLEPSFNTSQDHHGVLCEFLNQLKTNKDK